MGGSREHERPPLVFGAAADAVGHCLLVFSLVPPLTALPRWLAAEVANPLNARDWIVLAFLPARGLLALLHAFAAGLPDRVLAGVLAGVVLIAVARARPYLSTGLRGTGVGAVSGMLGGGLAVLLAASLPGADPTSPGGYVAVLVSGAVCGAIAAPTAFRSVLGTASDVPASGTAAATMRDDGVGARSSALRR